MAVFLINQCKFENCGLVFNTLSDLIQHIEDIHIVESSPQHFRGGEPLTGISPSYVLRLFREPKPNPASVAVLHKSRQRLNSLSPVPSLGSHRSSTPVTESDIEDDRNSEGGRSDDSAWLIHDEVSSDVILGMLDPSKHQGKEKPFVCPVPGCKKRYKNINGIKYHAKHGHRKDLRELCTSSSSHHPHHHPQKVHQCKCGKTYKSAAGLRQHCSVSHGGSGGGGGGETLVLPPGSQIITLTTPSHDTFKTPANNLPTALKNRMHAISTAKIPSVYRKSLVNGKTLLQPTSVLAAGGFTVTLPSGSVEIALPVGNALSLPPPPPLKGAAGLPSEGTLEFLESTSELDELAAVVTTS